MGWYDILFKPLHLDDANEIRARSGLRNRRRNGITIQHDENFDSPFVLSPIQSLVSVHDYEISQRNSAFNANLNQPRPTANFEDLNISRTDGRFAVVRHNRNSVERNRFHSSVNNTGEAVFIPVRQEDAPTMSDIEDFDPIENESHAVRVARNHRWDRIMSQCVLPLFLVGFSLITLGYALQAVRKTQVFLQIRALTVLITPLLGLKTQLDLSSVARFTLHLTLGHIPKFERLNYMIADISVSMVQAAVTAILSGYLAVFIVYFRLGRSMSLSATEVWMVLAISTLAACVTCLITGIAILWTTQLCFKWHIDANNVVVPFALCLGDVSTLGVLTLASQFLYDLRDFTWISPLIVVLVFLLTPACAIIAYKHPHTKDSLFPCWLPTFSSVGVSSLAGMLLEFEGDEYENMDLYQPLITGTGAAIAAIHFCRLASVYYRKCEPGSLPHSVTGKPDAVCFIPCFMFCPKRVHTPTYLILLGIIVPAQAIFSLIIWGLVPGHSKNCYPIFLGIYVASCFVQNCLLLYGTHVLLNILWKLKIDPGFYVIPAMHGISDIIGTILLLICCHTYKIKSCIPEESHHGHEHA